MTELQVSYQRLGEERRHNLAGEQETYRSNVAKETETRRANMTKEAEEHRRNVAQEAISWANLSETKRANQVRESQEDTRLTETERHNRISEGISATQASAAQDSATAAQTRADAAKTTAETNRAVNYEDVQYAAARDAAENAADTGNFWSMVGSVMRAAAESALDVARNGLSINVKGNKSKTKKGK